MPRPPQNKSRSCRNGPETITIGVLSDTHLQRPNDLFREITRNCFAGTDIILHAGDLTETVILEVFAGKEVHAVHGNMCSPNTTDALPRKKVIEIGGVKIGLIHNTGFSYDFEDQLFDEFEAVDCIVYGHTHNPVCQRRGKILLVNPGQFTMLGGQGRPGSYAILTIQAGRIEARIHEIRLPR